VLPAFWVHVLYFLNALLAFGYGLWSYQSQLKNDERLSDRSASFAAAADGKTIRVPHGIEDPSCPVSSDESV
jgi:hypothetical protein